MGHSRRHRSRSSTLAGRRRSRSMAGGEADIETSNKLLLQDAASTPPLTGGRSRRKNHKRGGSSHSRTVKRSRSRSRSHNGGRSRSRSREGGFGGLGIAATIKEALVPFGLFALQKRAQRRSRK